MEVDRTDHWVRQFLGNTGAFSFEEAKRALTEIQRNISAGLFPTTGGAVSLLARDDVEELYQLNRGFFPKFRPMIPDAGGRRAKTLAEWYVAAIEQAITYNRDPRTLENLVSSRAILSGIRPFALKHVNAMNGLLHTYHSSGVDWHRIHDYGTRLYGAMPRVGEPPYWLTDAREPLSVLAFTDAATRGFASRY